MVLFSLHRDSDYSAVAKEPPSPFYLSLFPPDRTKLVLSAVERHDRA